MALFRRNRPGGGAAAEQGEAISRFWAWWETQGARETSVAADERDPGSSVGALTEYVKAIHEGLSWELGPGSEGVHLLVVSPEGDPALRAVARRWLRAAPEPDLLWEYADSRPPVADPADVVLVLDGVDLDLAAAVAAARVSGTSIDLTVHHPNFEQLSDEARPVAAGVLLTSVLGEAAVDRWVGSLEVSTVAPLDAFPLTGVRSVVRGIAERWTGPDGAPAWVQLSGATPAGDKVLAASQVPLRPATAPHLDLHVAVQVPFPPDHDGLPGEAAQAALAGFQAHLDELLGGSGRTVAHETRQGIRLLHLYVDSTTPAADQVRAAIGGWENGRVTLTSEPDPSWSGVAHLSA